MQVTREALLYAFRFFCLAVTLCLAVEVLTEISLGQEDDSLARPVRYTEEPTPTDYDAAKEFGFSKRQVDLSSVGRRLTFSRKAIEDRVAKAMEDRLVYAQESDKALAALIKQAGVVLRARGHASVAKEIEAEYTQYTDAIYQMAMQTKEIGDHEAFSEFLISTHDKIETAIGSFWCKYFHFHDLYIINYAVPVVWHPEAYDLTEYLDHFAGHILSQYSWKHHGLAGVVAYWAVNIACMAGTSGMGAVTFACGPIAGLAEHVIDKNVAPPLGKRIWKKAQP